MVKQLIVIAIFLFMQDIPEVIYCIYIIFDSSNAYSVSVAQ